MAARASSVVAGANERASGVFARAVRLVFCAAFFSPLSSCFVFTRPPAHRVVGTLPLLTAVAAIAVAAAAAIAAAAAYASA